MLTKKQLLAFSLILTFFFSICNTKIEGYFTEIDISNVKVMIDISRGAYHNKFFNFKGNMTFSGNTVEINNDSITSLESRSGFFISQPDTGYTIAEKNVIKNFLQLGNRTLFVTGDSDYGGFWSPSHVNDLLDFLNSSLRMGADHMQDSADSLGAWYRLLATGYGNGSIANITKAGCLDGIYFHGSTSVLGYNGTEIIDLRKEDLPNVEVLIFYDENATSADTDLSNTDYDFYAYSSDTGYYPALACEKVIFGDKISYIIVAGEVVFADFKHMYDQFTDTGYLHYGQMFVNNLVNFFLANATNLPDISEFQQILFLSIISSAALIAITIRIKRKKK
ncbi:MAG: hypothetical protein H7645_03720 [Candidatus Heimdallarchaeota archaeon]|nr:hypothetical protein [Candidatus Heimdallarchaeota archaeon]MCK4769424.1 hypothetical protein [Candidatus Heimdallarchaeota archaeon]